MPAIHIDDSRWPIAVVTYIGVPSDAEFSVYLGRLEGLLSRREPHVVVADLRHSGVMPGRQRASQAEWLKRNQDTLAQLVRGCALVFSSPLLRIALQGILLLQPLPFRWAVCRTLDEAHGWAEGKLAGDPAAISPSLPRRPR